ncbi:hypothetical protein D3C71_1545300 [compost metagenome]
MAVATASASKANSATSATIPRVVARYWGDRMEMALGSIWLAVVGDGAVEWDDMGLPIQVGCRLQLLRRSGVACNLNYGLGQADGRA